MEVESRNFRTYGYRWVVLALFMFINLTMQVLWISYAPITGPAAVYYGVSDLKIGMFAMLFMIAFIPLSIPVSWVIDTLGFRVSVSMGAALMGIFGILRGMPGSGYWMVFACTIGIAIAQPFFLNAWTKMPANWFPVNQRATMVGLITLANIVGTALGMLLPPMLIKNMAIPAVQLLFGSIAAFSSLLFIVFARDKPPTPPCLPGMEVRALMLDGLKNALSVPSFWFFLAVSFIGFGIFNGVTTWIENIVRPRGFSPESAGTLGALMLIGGVLGAVVLPAFSDKSGRRKPFLFVGLSFAIPGLLGLAFATSAWLLYPSAFVLGFFLISTNPVGMQYAAEITRPTPEGTSTGLVQLCGQGAVVFVYIMEALRTKSGSFTPALLLSVLLTGGALLFVAGMKESVKAI